MGRKGSRYTIKEKLFYIGLVTQGMAPNAVQRKYGVEHSQVSRWVKRYGLQGIDGLRHRLMGKYPSELKLKIVPKLQEQISHTINPIKSVFSLIFIFYGLNLTGGSSGEKLFGCLIASLPAR